MRNKYIVFFLILMIILTGCDTVSKTETKHDEEQKSSIIDSEFCLISGNHVYELKDEMPFVNIKPMSVESSAGDGFKWEIYTYPSIEIKVLISDDNKKYFNKLTTTSSDFHTPRGIKVGDNFEKLSEAYNEDFGLYSSAEGLDGNNIYAYDPDDDVGFNRIFFYLDNDIINKIVLEDGIDG